MNLSYTFNEDAQNYDKWRPSYCKEVFDDIFNYSDIREYKKGLEIGIGTGLATEPFLEKGINITAIEPGNNLVNLVKDKYKSYSNFKVKQGKFEDLEDNNTYDIIYSATAFHWIPEEVGYSKAYELLNSGGTIAVFWNKPTIGDEALNQKIQKVYRDLKPKQKLVNNETRQQRIKESMKSARFKDIQMKLYQQTRMFNSRDYISLLETYSDHRSMDDESKGLLYSKIQEIIYSNNDLLRLQDTIELYLGKK